LNDLSESRTNTEFIALIVSNSHPIQDGLRALLSVLHQVKEINVAQNGPEAIALASRQQPALVLFDSELPEEDIWKTVRHLRVVCPNAVIVAMIDRLNQKEPALAASANSVQMKGFSAADLFLTLEDLIARHQANDQSFIGNDRGFEA
jgi:DNA-binding NarL/FixJ family response regulator